MFKGFLLILACLVGCGEKPLELPGQKAATSVVWTGIYHQTDRAPRIFWVMGKELDCAHGTGFFAKPNVIGPTSDLCVAGVFWRELYVAQVAWEPGETKLAHTSLAHELHHAALWLETGLADAKHQDPTWGTAYGQPFSRLDQAIETLTDLGL